MRGKILLTGCAMALALGFASQAAAQVPLGNHYLCRKVKDLGIPAKHVKQLGIVVQDQIGIDSCDTKKPFLLCSPLAIKNGPVPVPDPNLHYVCYKTTCAQKPAVNFDVTDQFNPLRLQTKKPFLLCNPAIKTPA
jgi:hypothetical protein